MTKWTTEIYYQAYGQGQGHGLGGILLDSKYHLTSDMPLAL